MQTETADKQRSSIKDDKEYIESYFKICELLLEKKLIHIKLKELEGRGSERALDKIKSFEDRIELLNERIKKMDSSFWAFIDNTKDKDTFFALEKFFKNNNLGIYEKRVTLFFLYLEFSHADNKTCRKSDITEIFDFDNNVFNRMRDHRYLTSSASLIKNGILSIDQYGRRYGCMPELTIRPGVVGKIVSVLNGEEAHDDKSSIDEFSNSRDDIGIIKEPDYKIEDIALKDEIMDKVMFLLKTSNEPNLKELGVFQKIKKGLGLTFLFYGPPGTGKSMLAEAIAAYCKKKLLIVEFPKIMNLWLGETEKNISNIFKTAKEKKVVICIDEADSLLYNRSHALQDHDIRFVNIMLQEIERYEGELILTSNMDTLLDPALERRVSLKVKFELPDKQLREKIWRNHIPDKVVVDEGVNFSLLAEQFELSGGYIKNAVFHAMKKLAGDNRKKLFMEDLLFGANLEKDGVFIKENKRKIGFSH